MEAVPLLEMAALIDVTPMEDVGHNLCMEQHVKLAQDYAYQDSR